jgi:hypothetical protein
MNATDRETTAGMRRCQRLPDKRTPVIRRVHRREYQEACRARAQPALADFFENPTMPGR